jgi:hypothetical protein
VYPVLSVVTYLSTKHVKVDSRRDLLSTTMPLKSVMYLKVA